MDAASKGLITQMSSLSAQAKAMCPNIAGALDCLVEAVALQALTSNQAFAELGKLPNHRDFINDPQFRKAYYRFCSEYTEELLMISIKAGELEASIPYEALKKRADVLAATVNYQEGKDKEIDLTDQYNFYDQYRKEYQDFFNFLKGEPVRIDRNNFAFLMKLALEYGSNDLIIACGRYCSENLKNFDIDSLNFVWEFAEEVCCYSWQLEILKLLKGNEDLLRYMNTECRNQFVYFKRCYLNFNSDASWSMNLYSDRDLNYFISIFSKCHFLRRCSESANYSSSVFLGYIQNSRRVKVLLDINEAATMFSMIRINLKPLLSGERADLLNHLFSKTSLREINLVGNEIDDVESETIARLLENNKTLEKLVLSYNNISGRGAMNLAEAMDKNSRLVCLDLSGNPIDNDCRKNLQEKNISGLIPT